MRGGLSLFLVRSRLPSGALNHLEILRLKDKLGTWALPTAELSLEGSTAVQVGKDFQGIKAVSAMLNITRLYNAVCSVAQTARGLQLVRDFSQRRTVFGVPLADQPLHRRTWIDQEAKHLAGFVLTFELAHLLGREECGLASAGEQLLLRLLTPVCKLFTAKQAVASASEVLEGFGGAGYVEDSGIPGQLRDAQVFPIWEGPTNVLSLDVLRVLQKTDSWSELIQDVRRRLASLTESSLQPLRKRATEVLEDLVLSYAGWSSLPTETQIADARGLAFHLAELYALSLMLSWAQAEAPAGRAHLALWIEHYAKYQLGSWSKFDSSDHSRMNHLWLDRLEA